MSVCHVRLSVLGAVVILSSSCTTERTAVIATAPTTIEICSAAAGRQNAFREAENYCAARGMTARFTTNAGQCKSILLDEEATISHFDCVGH
jgi:hypothetical protein